MFYFSSLQAEAEALVTLLRDFPDAKAWVTFTCKVGKSSSLSSLHALQIEHKQHKQWCSWPLVAVPIAVLLVYIGEVLNDEIMPHSCL